MKTEELAVEVDGTMTELLQLISSLNEEQINAVPDEGGWTAAQVARHLIISDSAISGILNGPINATERAPDELVGTIRAIMLDFDTKVEAADSMVPAAVSYEKEELLQSLQDIRTGVHEVIETLDLTKTCLAFDFPGLGHLTRLEMLYFILYHTQRHIVQLKRIGQQVVSLA